MGCGSSAGQVIDSKQTVFRLQQILVMDHQREDSVANGRIFLFGENRTQRKIIECQTKLNTVKTISSKTRIPCPKINMDPLEAMYEESQEIFSLGIYGLSMLPPYNKMLALHLQSNIIFMCGGRDYDHYNVKSDVYFYSVEDIKIMLMGEHTNELSPRTLYRPKYSRNRFQKMPSMIQKRYSHMGMYSSKSKSVLVFGGKNQKEETLHSCQIYSLLENVWRELPPMSVARADGHCFEHAGKVYVFGGRSSQTKLSKKIEVYSILQNQWSLLKFKIHRGIENALIFSQSPNQVLIVGGATHSYACKTVIKINLEEQSYIWDSQMNKEYTHPIGVTAGQNIFVFGGEKDICQIFNKNKWRIGGYNHRKNVELDELQDFSFTKESLVVKSTELSQRKSQGISKDQTVFFGTDQYPCIMIFNKSTGNTKKRAVPMILRLKKHMTVVQLPNKVFMLLGGSDKKQKKFSRSCFFYDANNNTATESLKMNEKKINFAAVYLENQVFVFGGYSNLQSVGFVTCQKFNLRQQKWQEMKRLTKPKYRVFAQVINERKIAVFGQKQKGSLIRQIQIYNTAKDYYESFEVKVEIHGTISMVYSLAQKGKVIILREGSGGNLQEIEISESSLRENQNEKQDDKQKTANIVYKMQSPNQSKKFSSILRQSKQKFQQQYQSSELHKNNVIAMKPKMIQIKPMKHQQSSSHVRQQKEDSSFEIQKIAEQNNVMMEPQRSDKKLRIRQKQTLQQPNFDDDEYFSIDTRSLEANFSTLKIKQTQLQKRQILAQRKHSNISQSHEISKQQQSKQQHPGNVFQGLVQQSHNIIKRQNQLYFFRQTEVVIYNIQLAEKSKLKIQNQQGLKLLQIS